MTSPPPPNRDDLRRCADALGLDVGDDDLAVYEPFVAAFVSSVGELESLTPPPPAPVGDRTSWQPSADENPLGAWYRRCSVRGADDGPLAGTRVALKDNILLAGVPMANGSALLDGFVPDVDATVASRILDAGGEIVGKAVCENLCLSAGSHTSATGPVRNPHDRSRSTGGSSSGCGALVAAGECDLAVGGDQGGSIRVPAAHCGIVGLKPTYGLVPCTGSIPLEHTLDHLGPMGRTVADVARLLEVLAGPDGLDPRQRVAFEAKRYVDGLGAPIDGLRIGVVGEGFDAPGSDPTVDDAVRAALDLVARASGASIVPVSVPWHRRGGIASAILVEGMTALLLRGHAAEVGSGGRGLRSPALVAALGRAVAGGDVRLPHTAAVMALTGEHLHRTTFGRTYALAQNLVPALTASYDDALRTVDVLAMPTTQTTAPTLPPPDASTGEWLVAAFTNAANTAPLDVTGHPALSVPCGTVDGLPVGLMLIGRHGADDVVLRAGAAVERAMTS